MNLPPHLRVAAHAPADPKSGTFAYDAAKAERAIAFFEKILV